MAGVSEPDSVYPLARLCRLRPRQLLRPWPLKTARDVFTERNGGQERIRTFEGVSQQIYSLPRLTASVPTRFRIQQEFLPDFARRVTCRASGALQGLSLSCIRLFQRISQE